MTSSAIVHENKFNNFQSRFSPKWGTLFSDQNYFLLVCPIWQDKILLQELTDFLRKLYACVVIVGVYWVLYHDQRKRIFLLLVSSHTAFYYFSNAFFFVYTILLLYRGSIHLTKMCQIHLSDYLPTSGFDYTAYFDTDPIEVLHDECYVNLFHQFSWFCL